MTKREQRAIARFKKVNARLDKMLAHAKDDTLRLDCARFRERGARAVDG